MKRLLKLSLLTISLGLVSTTNATDADVDQLNDKVNLQVELIAETGLLATSIEMEAITGDILATEIINTELTVAQAVEMYQLTPTLERYIKIKKAQADLAKSNGGGAEPPFN
jgi:Trk K+ transport system NAD-binding subunit